MYGNKEDGFDIYKKYGGISEEHRSDLEQYFSSSPGPFVWKLQHFTKYVPRHDLTKFLYKNEIFKKVLNIHGAIIECGVFAGASLMTWAQLSAIFEPMNTSRLIVGFDTFEGFPSVNDKDKNEDQEDCYPYVGAWGPTWVKGLYEDLQRSIEIYNKNRLFKAPRNKVSLVKGDIRETLPKFLKDNSEMVVSLLHLDADLYGPTRVALEEVIPRMPKGAVIVFDELSYSKGESCALFDTLGLEDIKIQRFPFDTHVCYIVLGD